MIRLGIVGCNYGRSVILPAFRTDKRCEVVALAGTDAARSAQLAAESGIGKSFGRWENLVDDEAVDAVAIATPPRQQPVIALRALDLRKPIFVEKPLAADMPTAVHLAAKAAAAKIPAMIDFEFRELISWRRAKTLLDEGAIGALRHVAVSWQMENYATRMRLQSWKTRRLEGGGVLGNFVSHCFYYLEWFCGPISGLSARLHGLPGAPDYEATAALAFDFASGAGGSLTMSSASFLGSGHRIEFYGEEGTLALLNPTADYMRGFELLVGRRPADRLERVDTPDPDDAQYSDGRVAPVARLASRFLDAIEGKGTASPSLADGLRVQRLIEAARHSHDRGEFMKVEART